MQATREWPVILFDGECAFCVAQASRLRRLLEHRAEFASFRDPEVRARFAAIPGERFEREMVFVAPDGRVSGGAEAVARALALRLPTRWLAAIYFVPGLRSLVDRVYRAVARRRFRLGGQDCAGSCALHREPGVR